MLGLYEFPIRAYSMIFSISSSTTMAGGVLCVLKDSLNEVYVPAAEDLAMGPRQ